ncbi:MAG: hypothetical protein HQK62_07430 [Desulfamplus sp.]|nr:hypothetical protein [Desulfamplus sp.]
MVESAEFREYLYYRITGTAGARYWLSATTNNESPTITANSRDFHIKGYWR